ncbi:hypothetical protein [Nocardioides sp.]|uniref:hypothetical protein n=1 Tax=Nocardioides sp. TaxID=35761 RepID=UPI00271C6CA4|nr:hypothetical protein [Nocardioides sp.]MDO9455629.1 hypothetical protein [Nocardioides sp.]
MTDNVPPYSDVAGNPYATAGPGNRWSAIAIALGVFGAFLFPIIFCPAGLVVGCVAMGDDERLWLPAVLVPVAGLLGGLVLWISVFGQVSPFMG